MSNIEQGINKPGFDFLYKLSHRYNVNPFYLFHGKGPMFLEGTPQAGSVSDTHDFGAFTEMIEELLTTMEKSNIVKLSVLEFFHKYRIQQKSLIDAEIKEFEEKKRNSKVHLTPIVRFAHVRLYSRGPCEFSGML